MEPLLSVCLITYNHVKYIAQAIEGVLMQKVDFQIIPNPAADFLTIEIESSESSVISGSVFNAFGQLQHRFPTEKPEPGGNDWRLSLAAWPSGVYFFTLNTGKESVTRAFVIKK